MNKFVVVISLALLSVAYAQFKGDTYGLKAHGNFATHTDDYITLNGLQYKAVLDRYDGKLQEFSESYLEQLETVTINRELAVKSVVSSIKRWDPMLVLSDTTKDCIVQYRYNIPTVEATRAAIAKCHEDYSKQLTTLVKSAASTRNVLSGYIATYNKEVEKCGTTYNKSDSDYTLCVAALTGKTNELVIANEKSFQVQLEAAECTAKANVKSAIDCSYSVQVHTHTIIAETEVLIDRCMWNRDVCKPCEDHTCAESFTLTGNVKNETIIHNPFYGRSDRTKCIMLSVE